MIKKHESQTMLNMNLKDYIMEKTYNHLIQHKGPNKGQGVLDHHFLKF